MKSAAVHEGEGHHENKVVIHITEERDGERYGIAFDRLAGIYFLNKKSPDFASWFKLLQKSLAVKRPVSFRYLMGGHEITHVELAKP